MAEDAKTTIIIKKKKHGHHGHHGGAWKVAYADFVTAMMAFFLLLWLISTASDEQKEGIADYFSPSVASVSSSSGAGQMLAGRTLSIDGAALSDSTPLGMPTPTLAPSPDASSDSSGEQDGSGEGGDLEDLGQREDEAFAEAEALLQQAMQEVPELMELAPNLIVERTPEGLRIQIVDQERNAMFASGSARMNETTRQLLDVVTQAIAPLPNKVAITGHTDATPFRGAGDYSNWELSADRANASRRAMLDSGLPISRISTVEGRADRDLIEPENPEAARNRRISILLLREPRAYAALDNGVEMPGAAPRPRPSSSQSNLPSDAWMPQPAASSGGELGPFRIYRDDD